MKAWRDWGWSLGLKFEGVVCSGGGGVGVVVVAMMMEFGQSNLLHGGCVRKSRSFILKSSGGHHIDALLGQH